MSKRDFQDRLGRRARRAGITISDEAAAQLEVYYKLLSTWNRRINLSGLDVTEPTSEALDRLLIEPLMAARYAPAAVARLIDLGSGGGSPGIPLALALPGSHLVLVESKTRKSVFLREAVREIGLDAEVVTARFEELLLRPDLHETHDLLSVRAVRLEPSLLNCALAFVRPGARLLLFRSIATVDASDFVAPPLKWIGTYPLIESLRSRLVVLDRQPASSGR